ncbi:MAG: nucleotidyltransferase domain-containing protein [Candidatus Brocadiaceae bacterium]|nr:nucleotidyltransferase domain-containing protein [Candidatus Brocadiaceae bacterium]
MKLSQKEREIIERFKQIISKKFPDEIVEVLVFGSKARGDATKESDIDVLVITSSNNWKRGDEIREIGYGLDDEIDYKLSIQVISQEHFDYLKQNNFQFIKSIKNESITV